jgi:tetratricopeptide (TPR) repeat protein
LDLAAFDQLLAAAQSNPAINTPTATEKSMPPLLGMLALERGDPSTALRNFDRALAANISPETAAGQASLLASRGFYREALAHLDTYERLKASVPPPPWGMPWVHQQVLDYQRYWPRELSRLRHNVESELSP